MDEQHPTTDSPSRWPGLLDLGARWFQARSVRRDPPPLGEHGHWDPVARDWRYHVHEAESRRAS